MTTESSRYAQLGASSSKAGMLRSLALPEAARFFAEPMPDVCGDPDWYSVLHADGAGTKSIVAYLAWRESGDLRWFRSLAQDSLVMNLDDVACLGAFEGLALSNTIGRNRSLIPDEVVGAVVAGYRDTVERLAGAGLRIHLAGGETADMGDAIRTLVVDSTLFGRVRRSAAIDTTRITSGDIIIGLSNTGQATYEEHENSSIGSNGLTLARHALIARALLVKYPEIVDPALDPAATCQGRFGLFETPPGMTHSVAEALLSPTRTYAPIIRQVHAALGRELHAAIHCSGGGATKILRFGSRKHYIKDDLFPVPPLFTLIQATLQIPWREMYSVFNMGHRMEIVCPAERWEAVAAIARSFRIEPRRIGYVSDSVERNRVTLKTPVGTFDY